MNYNIEPFITSTKQLCKFCNLHVDDAPYTIDLSPSYPCHVPLSYAEKMAKKDWFDPLLLQVLPRIEENEDAHSGFCSDPVGDSNAMVCPGIIHKYPGRILLITTSSCAIHCRFCFRRNHSVCELPPDGSLDSSIITHIRNTPSITEVILSGGDPLSLEPQRFNQIISLLLSIKQLTTIRLHTRIPIVSPKSVNPLHLDCIESIMEEKQCVITLHCNHPQELGDDNNTLIQAMRNRGALLFNQAVLLKGINDSVGILQLLANKLLARNIVPYYLHQLDRVSGTHHFEVAQKNGLSIISELRSTLPGYAVPRYVREVAGDRSKRIIC